MSILARTTILLAFAASLGGCAATSFHVGHDFDPGIFSANVVRGKTTQEEVRTWLGAPTSTGVRIDPDGTRYNEWTYYMADGQLSELSETRLKTLEIKFDLQGVVRGYAWSSSSR
ncbi:MAG: hypothetical protein KGJ15_05095 [Betaproteobacteria bacterium]|nr:hypothetical protein [Betaproteobacteria bacterium]MDE2132122.1 hypothetical protein [Betaproteobacteria bacterium]MDE2212561.1 hypothetical protein [Betaproteobacteria bacterium]